MTTFGRISLRMIRAGEAPETLAASTNSRLPQGRAWWHADQAGEAHPAQEPLHDDDAPTPGRRPGSPRAGSTKTAVTTGMKAMKNSCWGKDEEEVGDPADAVVGPAAEVAADQPMMTPVTISRTVTASAMNSEVRMP